MPADSTRFDIVNEQAALDALACLPINCFERDQWVRAVSIARRRRHRRFVIRAVRSRRPPAYLFGALHTRYGITVFESMPMGGYGGWVCEEVLEDVEELELTTCWLRRAPWCIVVMTCKPGRCETLPEPPSMRLPGRLRRLTKAKEIETHILELKGDDASMLGRARAGIRSYLRKVDQLGLSYSIGQRDQLPEFLDLYRRGRLGWKTQPASLLNDDFFSALAGDAAMDVWIARRDGQPVGAAVFLLGRHEVQYQASGSEKIAGPISAMDALLWTAARYYRDRGFRTMNMGASEGMDSVRRFKEKFGATAVAYRQVSYVFPRLMSWLRRTNKSAPKQ